MVEGRWLIDGRRLFREWPPGNIAGACLGSGSTELGLETVSRKDVSRKFRTPGQGRVGDKLSDPVLSDKAVCGSTD